ncbi:hypothetical protein MTO96_025686 [Rhipicephalus appendiculatus]
MSPRRDEKGAKVSREADEAIAEGTNTGCHHGYGKGRSGQGSRTRKGGKIGGGRNQEGKGRFETAADVIAPLGPNGP